ncbi:aminopeptidase N [Thalassomonas actiniarum]|uniref:Aminopeptidase N n=1 Tax=Thalassomonas actiniarum TaxID=485447 RepID=A0AAF0C3M8_9GAMM|nr:aminopeptidase N [Thalassomonas actiniarum]WDD98859.1 aminopeptidase N [Thalassomonas actiniarum]
MKLGISTLLALSLGLTACASKDDAAGKSLSYTPREQASYLTQQQAALRSARVSNVDYVLDFTLGTEETFSAISRVDFDLNDVSSPLTLDLDQAKVTKVVVNGEEVSIDYNQWFITLSEQNLKLGRNSVSVSFERKHSTNGEGLHRFKDPVDGKVYLYSHFEPAAAQQMFALFDQPDLKANFEMRVLAPNDWHVFTAMKESRTEQVGDKKRWYFDSSLRLSPYNFSLHAGPYREWQDNSGKYPFRLFARQSVAKQVNPSDWFTFTHQGVGFFEDYYGIDYPFRKYDQVLVPDFLYGAMENAAAITFSESSFLSSGEMSHSQRENLARVIMHEMAHQWFGNLVTMKWWNGLWLNESFAAFMATLATAEATEFTDVWRTFYARGKQAAYRQDQRVTTHPIEVPIATSHNAFDNIDAITYSKGASALKQLGHLLGEETFRRGIHNYLSKNAYQNAELDDFINALAKAADRNLDQWKQDWLYHAGVNTIRADYQCRQGKISRFALKQSTQEGIPTLREQKVQLGLFNSDNKQLKLTGKLAVTYKGAVTQVDELIGRQCPELVYPNYQDWGFVKVNLDQRSFNTAKQQLSRVADPLLRSMLWQSLWDSVRDGQLALNEYLEIALLNIEQEQDYTILGQVLSQISQGKNYLNRIYGPKHSLVQAVSEQLEQLSWRATLANKADRNKLRRWFSYYRTFASSPQALDKLLKLLQGKTAVDNLEIDQDKRWQIIGQLSRFQHPQAGELIEQELARDNSDSGQKSALYARVIVPDAKVKAAWLEKIQSGNSDLPFSKLRTAMNGLYPAEQNQLAEQTAQQRLATLAQMDKDNNPVFMRSYARRLIPATCSEASVKRLDVAIENSAALSAGTQRRLLEAHQEDQRCLTIKNKML